MSYLGWRSPDELSLKELDEFLLARAMEHDSPSLLFRLACEHLITALGVRPGPVKLLERVASARARAERETHDRIAHPLTKSRRAELDGLLVVDPEMGHDPAAVAGHRAHGGLGRGGENRGQEAGVPARPGRTHPGSVQLAG